MADPAEKRQKEEPPPVVMKLKSSGAEPDREHHTAGHQPHLDWLNWLGKQAYLGFPWLTKQYLRKIYR